MNPEATARARIKAYRRAESLVKKALYAIESMPGPSDRLADELGRIRKALGDRARPWTPTRAQLDATRKSFPSAQGNERRLYELARGRYGPP